MDHSLKFDQADDAGPERQQATTWMTPELLRLGSITSLTTKVDNRGKNDGGRWPRRRT